MLSPPWVLTSRHGEEILELLSKLDKAEKEEREWEKLKRREMKKQETIQCCEAEQQQKKLKLMEQSLAVSPWGVLSNSSVYNTPVRLMPMTLLVSPILCLSLQLIAMPVRLTVIIGFKFTSCYILPICIYTASHGCITILLSTSIAITSLGSCTTYSSAIHVAFPIYLGADIPSHTSSSLAPNIHTVFHSY